MAPFLEIGVFGSAANEVSEQGMENTVISEGCLGGRVSERARASLPRETVHLRGFLFIVCNVASVEMITAKRKSSQKRLAKAFSIASQLFLWLPIV